MDCARSRSPPWRLGRVGFSVARSSLNSFTTRPEDPLASGHTTTPPGEEGQNLPRGQDPRQGRAAWTSQASRFRRRLLRATHRSYPPGDLYTPLRKFAAPTLPVNAVNRTRNPPGLRHNAAAPPMLCRLSTVRPRLTGAGASVSRVAGGARNRYARPRQGPSGGSPAHPEGPVYIARRAELDDIWLPDSTLSAMTKGRTAGGSQPNRTKLPSNLLTTKAPKLPVPIASPLLRGPTHAPGLAPRVLVSRARSPTETTLVWRRCSASRPWPGAIFLVY